MHPKNIHTNTALDQEINAALKSIAQSQPREGIEAMNTRLLAAIAAAKSTQTTPRTQAKFWLPLTTAAAAILIAATLLTLHHGRPQAEPAASNKFKPASTTTVANQTAAPTAIAKNPIPTKLTQHKTHHHQTIPLTATLELNQPAPPLPLTEQERLLLTIARKDDPREIAIFLPTTREENFPPLKTNLQTLPDSTDATTDAIPSSTDTDSTDAATPTSTTEDFSDNAGTDTTPTTTQITGDAK